MQAYNDDLRRRVIEAIEGGLSTRAAARRFAIGVSTAGTWHRRWKDIGNYQAYPQGGRKGSLLDKHKEFLEALIDNKADIKLGALADRLCEERSLRVAPSTIWYFLDKHAITYPKRQPMRASKNALMS